MIIFNYKVVSILSFPIPKSLGDKILSVCGGAITVIGVAITFVKAFAGQGFDVTGIIGVLGGAGMIFKGMEEFINGDITDAANDIATGTKEVETSAPAVKAEVKAVQMSGEFEASSLG